MALVSQFGAAILAMQDALRKSIDGKGTNPSVANFLTVWLNRDEFLKSWGLPLEESIEEFRSLLREDGERFVIANGWTFSGILSINILLRQQEVPSIVQAERRDLLYELKVRDDSGTRQITVSQPTSLLGRAHDSPPRSFLPIHDASRSFSREHLLLTFRDLKLNVHLLGRNKTEFNGNIVEVGSDFQFDPGDVICCGPHTIERTALSV
ncbi:MAG: FHA domain-containing protein [Ignavibacteriae bacterium]|nr:FHA domain-containing protein [Ignavibacteriota bacterium]MCB9215659.1 FHA domain-containing protein [Ignavibacteria bacterium]